ncbi:MAG: ABC transporter permease [Gaiellales bacterium]
MSSLVYTRYELLRTFRNRQFFAFSLGFPLVLFFLIAGPNRNDHDLASSGLSALVYYMVGLASFGTMSGVLSSGARIAGERSIGWNRQLRLTPLSARSYFRAKIVTAYAMALASIIALDAAGTTLGVRLPPDRWLSMTALMLVALIPFAALGILGGHLLTTDTIGPAMGGSTALFAFLGGTWFPISGHGVLHAIAECLPSYWLVRASHVALGGRAWTATGWIVIAAWTVCAALLAGWAYRRDTGRI